MTSRRRAALSRRPFPALALAAAAAAATLGPARVARAAPSFVSNTQFRRTPGGDVVGAQDGNLVNARLPDGRFALVGILYGDCAFTACANTSFGACGFGAGSVRAWASPDLSQDSWVLLDGEILPAAQRPRGIYFRPHVVYNARTQRFVLWLRWLNATGPALADDSTLYLTASAPAVDGPYAIALTNVPMFYNNSADDNLFVDEDGAAYIAHTCRSCGTHIVVERLADDFLSSLGASDPRFRSGLVGPGSTEAPALFRVGDTYFLTMSHLCCFCTEGSETLVFAAPAPLGPYESRGSLGNAPGAQQNFVFVHPSVAAGAPLWSGNRWGSDPAPPPPSGEPLFDRSLQYWAPLSVERNGSIAPLVWLDNFTIDVV